MGSKYIAPIEQELLIINKNTDVQSFTLNKPQKHFLEHMGHKNIILKARQMGFSSVILGYLTIRFLLKRNERLVVVSHESGATQKLMDRVKFFIESYEKGNKIKLPTKYNSRSEIVNEDTNSTIYIGTAGSKSFGRGDTITALHLSEFAFYSNPEEMLAGVLQALTPEGVLFIESTANGFNFYKTLWDEAEDRGFSRHFYNSDWLYTHEFIENKKKELGRLFEQEYPTTPEEAFLTSGDMYFNGDSLKWYLSQVKDPTVGGIYV